MADSTAVRGQETKNDQQMNQVVKHALAMLDLARQMYTQPDPVTVADADKTPAMNGTDLKAIKESLSQISQRLQIIETSSLTKQLVI
ncbi:hypothetical protein HDE_09633 [Halotydeus destructor]|nr:hypothetical protein HDE_09633 [Halotydeus destructor]